MVPQELRLFIALPLTKATKKDLNEAVHPLQDLAFRWVREENLHLTLKFIGNWPADRLDELDQRIGTALAGQPSFSLQFSKLDAFPSWRRPRVFVLASQGSPALNKVVNLLEEKLEPLGIEKERKSFRPHITLARRSRKTSKEDERALQKRGRNLKFSARIQADRIFLYQSELLSTGAVYKKIKEYQLV